LTFGDQLIVVIVVTKVYAGAILCPWEGLYKFSGGITPGVVVVKKKINVIKWFCFGNTCLKQGNGIQDQRAFGGEGVIG
jgi:hypothetical protein